MTDDDDEDANEVIYRRSNIPSASMLKSNVMVTDLDKSMDSLKTLETERKPQTKQMFCGVNSLPMATNAIQTQRNHIEFFKTIGSGVRVCSSNELKQKTTASLNTCASLMEFFTGTYRKSTVTLRNFSPTDSDSGSDDERFIAESVLRRDLEILKLVHTVSIK